MLRRILILLLVTAGFPAGLVAANAPGTPGAAFTDPYDIEILLFEQPRQASGEHWPEEPGEPDLGLAIGDLSRPGLAGPDAVLLPEAQQQFGPAAYTLRRKGAVIHAHLLWRQDLRERGSPTWYRVGDERLDGLIRIGKGRYLHLDTDLLLRPLQATQPYRVQLYRRMRSGETHYVDHPLVGILIRAERVQTAAAPAQPEADLPPPAQPEVETAPQDPQGPPGSLPRATPDPT